MEIDILVTIVLSLLSLIFPKSRLVTGLFFLFMWTLWGWNTWNGDYDAYEKIFLGIEDGVSAEGGYWLLNSFFHFFVGDFQTFLIIISFIVLFCIHKFVIEYSPYPALFALLYFFIFIMEFVFIRDYIASTLFIIALSVVSKGVKYKVAYFILLLLLACSIHSFYLVYFVFLPCIQRDVFFQWRKWFKYLLLINLCLIFAGDAIIPYMGEYIGSKFSFYENAASSITNSSYALLIIIVLIMLTRKFSFINLKNDSNLVRILYNINILSLVFIGVFYNLPYASSRFMRILFFLDVLFILICFSYTKGVYKLLVSLSLIILVAIISAFFMQMTFVNTIIPLYKCNLIWGDEYYTPVY